jgi:DNA polymerase-3 subunit delta'
MMLCGHKDLKEVFSVLAKKGSLSHGYIFFGEPQVGKFSFALSLANFLETGNFESDGRMLSEILVIKESGIDCVREIKNFLWQKPQNSSKRTVIIDNADLLTAEAQSAILKITEEPPEHALIILIVSNLNNILPPILSRLQKIYFSRIGKNEIADLLIKGLGVKKEKAEELAILAYGRPGRAIDMSNNKELPEIDEMAQKFLRSSGSNRSQFIKKLVDDQKERPEMLDRFFESLIVILRKDPVKNHQMIKSVLSRLFLIKSYNVNKRLQIEAI